MSKNASLAAHELSTRHTHNNNKGGVDFSARGFWHKILGSRLLVFFLVITCGASPQKCKRGNHFPFISAINREGIR